jgi:hypothetical protein
MPTTEPRLVTPTAFVLRPGDPLGARGNVYLNSASLYNAMLLVHGSKRIEIDGSFAPVNWLADGVQDLSGVEFFSSQDLAQGFTLNLNDGVQWTFDAIYINGVDIVSQSNSPIATVNSQVFVFLYLEGAIESDTAAPFFLVEAGDLSFEVSDQSVIGDAIHPVIKTVTPGAMDGLFFNNSELATAALDPTSTGTFSISYDASSAPENQAPLTPTLTLLDLAPNVAYTPAVPADWSPAPTQVKSALDQLAARIVGTQTNIVANVICTGIGNAITAVLSVTPTSHNTLIIASAEGRMTAGVTNVYLRLLVDPAGGVNPLLSGVSVGKIKISGVTDAGLAGATEGATSFSVLINSTTVPGYTIGTTMTMVLSFDVSPNNPAITITTFNDNPGGIVAVTGMN